MWRKRFLHPSKTKVLQLSKKTAIFFILFLITLGQVSIDLYLPSMPAMARYWHVDTSLIQQTMTTFLIGYSLSQLFYGPLSERYGRRPILLTGLFVYFLASIICALSPSVHALLLSRLLQGVGAGSTSVLTRAIMRDVFAGKALAKVSSYSSITWSIVPMIAPVFGGYIQHYLGWRANFWMLVLITALALLLSLLFCHETQNKTYRQPLTIKRIWQHYRILLYHPLFIGNMFVLVAMYAVMVAFNIAAPFILQNQVGLNSVQYGWAIITVTLGYLVGSFLAAWLSSRFSYSQSIYLGLAIYMISVLVFLLFALLGYLNLWVFIVPMFFVMISSSIVYPIATAGSLHPFPKLAGIAGALFGVIVIVSGGVSSLIIAFLSETNQLPLALFMLIAGFIAIMGYFILVTKLAKKIPLRVE